jgi:hypothetical protein
MAAKTTQPEPVSLPAEQRRAVVDALEAVVGRLAGRVYSPRIKLLSVDQVCEATGLGQSTIYRMIENDLFPKPQKGTVHFLILHHLRASQYDASWTDSAVRRFTKEMGCGLDDVLNLSRADLGVAEKVDLSGLRDAARLDLADVVEERAPADFELRDRLTHDLLRVLPDVFVAPFAVAEADHRFDLREDGHERAGHEESVEPGLGVTAHHDAIEALAHGVHVAGGGRANIHRGGLDGLLGRDLAAALGLNHRPVEGVHRALRVRSRRRTLH